MSEHFNVMNRLVAARLSSRLEKISLDEGDQESTTDSVSSASPTDPPPSHFNTDDRQVGTHDSFVARNVLYSFVFRSLKRFRYL